MDDLLKAIEALKRAYKESGVDMVTVEINLDETRVRIDGENFEMPKQKQLTNREWLCRLSDEELVCWLNMYRICTIEQLRPHNAQTIGETMCNWLRAEHKGVE